MTMNRAQKIKNLLKVLEPEETDIDFSKFDNEVQKLKDALKEKIEAKTLDDVNNQLEKNRKRMSFEPLQESFEELKGHLQERENGLMVQLDEKMGKLSEMVKKSNEETSQNSKLSLQKESEILNAQIENLISEVAILSQRKVEIPDFAKQIKNTEGKLGSLIESVKSGGEELSKKERKEIDDKFIEFEKALKKLRIEALSRGGGAMNRKITFGGVDYLTRFTDINYKPGTNVGFTIADNQTTKMVDVTITATGGSSSVAGTVRSIKTVSVSSTIGTTAGTDQVILANDGIMITMPDAILDTNLYTIKNVGVSSVLIATILGQTIDAQANIIMPIQYTSIDLISDSANWNIT